MLAGIRIYLIIDTDDNNKPLEAYRESADALDSLQHWRIGEPNLNRYQMQLVLMFEQVPETVA